MLKCLSRLCCRSHDQAKMLDYPLGMMAAATAPEAQQPAHAQLLQIATNSSDPDLAPWLCWLLAGAQKLAAAELNIPFIPPGLPVMPNLAHLILRCQRTCLADIQSALQAAPNLETLLLGQDWCWEEPPTDDSTAWDIIVPPRLRHLSLENICPSSLSLPAGCTVSFSGQLRELEGMFGAAGWKLRGGRLKMLDAVGFCHGGLAFKYPNVAVNLGTVEVLRLRESPFYTVSSAAEEWTLGPLPAESTACITTLHISAQDVAVTVPLWPALRHVKLDAHMTLSLDFEDVEASAAALESFEYSDNVKERAGLKRFQSVLAAQGRRIISKGRGYKAPKALEQPVDGVTDVSELCCCGCCTGCLFGAGALPDARSVREIVPLRSDGHQGESDFSEEDEESEDEGDYEEEGSEDEYSDESDEDM